MKIKSDYHGEIECNCDERSSLYCCKVPVVCDRFLGWIEKDGLTHEQRMAPMKKYFARMRGVRK